MPDNDCPVCNGRKIIITRDYQDCEREEPCPHCSEHEHCVSCITLRAENARLEAALREIVKRGGRPFPSALSIANEALAALTPPGAPLPKEGGGEPHA